MSFTELMRRKSEEQDRYCRRRRVYMPPSEALQAKADDCWGEEILARIGVEMEAKQYAQRDHEAQGELYMLHLGAMTAEGLHSKSDIAGELAHRDKVIEDLVSALQSWVDVFDRVERNGSMANAMLTVLRDYFKENLDAARAALSAAKESP